MGTIEALALVTVMAASLELGILIWARATLTAKENSKALHVLVFNSAYRFFWLPKLICGIVMIIAFTLSFSIESVNDSMILGIISLSLIPVFGGFVAYEAVRTKE